MLIATPGNFNIFCYKCANGGFLLMTITCYIRLTRGKVSLKTDYLGQNSKRMTLLLKAG